MNIHLKRFQLNYPKLVEDLRACSHHYDKETLNPFHYEGDCFSHLCLVTKQLEGSYLELTGVLHDIGKVATRYENHEKKRVRFSGHENMSAFMCLSIFKDWQIPQDEREFLFKLIALHGEPYRLLPVEMAKRCTNDEYLAKSLYLFGLADHKGRFFEGEDKHQHLEIIAPEKPASEFTKEVVFMIGLPGSGKSTYIKENLKDYIAVSRDSLVEDNAAPKCSYDDKMTYNEAWKMADQEEVDRKLQAALQRTALMESKVVIDMTNLTRKQRLQKLKMFKDFKKKAVVLLPDMITLFKRLESRPDKTIGEDVIKKMVMNFNPPSLDEFDFIEWRFE